jgi:hypothetical protein
MKPSDLPFVITGVSTALLVGVVVMLFLIAR